MRALLDTCVVSEAAVRKDTLVSALKWKRSEAATCS